MMATFNSDKQLKILILLILNYAKSPIPSSALCEILGLCDINSLNIQICIDELIEQKHLILIDDYAKLSETGVVIAEELKGEVPLTVRQKAASITSIKIAELRQALNVQSDVSENEGSFIVNLILRDRDLKLLDISLFSPTRIGADIMSKTFTQNPEDIYKRMLNILLDESI